MTELSLAPFMHFKPSEFPKRLPLKLFDNPE
jgi:hypothetical protein